MSKQLELEEIIIGILLRNPNLILSESIDDRWFMHLRRPIQAMLKLASSGVDIDPILLSDELGQGQLSNVVNWHRNTNGAASNYSRYLDRLKDEFNQIGIRAALQKALNEIDNGGKSISVLSNLFSDAQFIQNHNGKKYSYTSEEAMNKFAEYLDSAHEARKKGNLSVRTGIDELDKVTGGMHPSDLIIVGARPAVGKTAFSTTVLLNSVRKGKKVGFISTEMSVDQNMTRLSSMITGIPAKRIREADLSEEEAGQLKEIVSTVNSYPFFICDKTNMTPSEVSMQCRAWQLQHGLDLVIVDYLTRIKPDKSSGNQHLDVAEVVTSMKNIARDLNIPVMVLAQLNRNIEHRADKRPLLSDLRDSGVIEQEADGIWMLHRPTDDESEDDEQKEEPQILIQKNRHGGSDYKAICKFIPEIMRWESR